MGLFNRTAARRDRQEPHLAAPAPAEARNHYAVDGWGAAGSALGSGGTGRVSVHLAENLGSITAAVGLLASALGSLPPFLVVDGPAGRSPAPSTAPALRLLSRPNAWQSWPAFMEWLTASVLLHGNGLAMIVRDGRGAPLALIPVNWAYVLPSVIQGAAGPRLAYDVTAGTPETELLGIPRRLLAEDVLHVRARSTNGLIGVSVLSRAAAVISEAQALNTLVRSTWERGARPAGVIRAPHVLTPPQREMAQLMLARFSGAANAGKTPLLEGGWEWTPLQFSSLDAEILSSRKLSNTEVAALFHIPPALLGDGAGPGSDLLLAQFAITALTPLVTTVEAEVDYSVLPAGMHLQLSMDGLVRGNYSAMVGANSVAKQSGWLTANDCRRAAGYEPLPGGDELTMGAPPSFPADAKGISSLAPHPGPGAGDLGNPGTNENQGAG